MPFVINEPTCSLTGLPTAGTQAVHNQQVTPSEGITQLARRLTNEKEEKFAPFGRTPLEYLDAVTGDLKPPDESLDPDEFAPFGLPGEYIPGA